MSDGTDATFSISVPERTRIASQLVGEGIEVGPGGQPFPVTRRARVRYVDRWTPDEARVLYPEVPDEAFLEPDVVANLDVEKLHAFPTSSLDFVVASHVLEHLADPLGFLAEVHRVLRPGGLAVVLLPDRRRTFDKTRQPTPLAHLVEDLTSSTTSVADYHIEDFLEFADRGASFTTWPANAGRAEFLEWHRQRSIHVHCWTEREFHQVLLFAVVGLGLGWEIVDRLTLADDGMEFGYVLRKPRLRSIWERLGST
jgi:SAM-dependent methyltransferase